MPKKKKVKKDSESMENTKDLLSQISDEYEVGKRYLDSKKDKWEKRLKLYNNQKKDDKSIGDPLLFGVLQTILAALYDDKLMVEFEGREIGDDPNAEIITMLANYDYDKMGKDKLDYEWMWNTCFFGRALCAVMEFDKGKVLPIPELFDPMVTVRDPLATSINGNLKGQGGARFFGRPLYMNEHQLKNSGFIKSEVDKLFVGAENFSELGEAKEARDESAGTDTIVGQDSSVGNNKYYELLQWFTYYKGERVMCITDSSHNALLRMWKVEGETFPVAERVLFPTPNDYDGVSIPDLVEDKQRYRAIILNNAAKSIESNQYPTYFFNSNKVSAPQYLNYNLDNKFIPVDGSPGDVVKPMERQVIKQEALWILDQLSNSADKATATPAIRQGGLSQEKRQATELSLVNQGVDARYSLSAKVFGWSEKQFWRLWFNLYKENYNKIVKNKTLKLTGVLGGRDLKLTGDNFKTQHDLDIKVESKVVSDGQKMDELKKVGNFKMLTAQDATVNQRYVNRKLAKLSGFTEDEMILLYPPTPDEVIAVEENGLLSDNKPVPVSPNDNDIEHLFIHNQAKDSKAKEAHIKTHKAAMKIKKENPAAVPQPTMDEGGRSKQEDKGSLPKVNYDSNLI